MAIDISNLNAECRVLASPQLALADLSSEERYSHAVLALLGDLQSQLYDHLCPTPETQNFALKKRRAVSGDATLRAKNLQDVWGWSLPVSLQTIANLLPPAILSELIETGVLVADKLSPNLLHPRLRVSTLFPCSSPPNYSVHSSWPTSSSDSVFFGPETYRFVRYLSSVAPRKADSRLVVDVCSGAGAGAFQLAKSYPNATVIGLDINPKAIQLAEINARHLFPDRESTAPIQMVTSDGFSGIISFVKGQVDVVTINPPFIAGDKRTYAAGGPTGMELILRIIGEARDALKIGGELYGHMAAPVSFGGEDRFKSALLALADRWELVTYDILDVDIFGEEMESPDNYPDIARLASVGLVLKRIA